MKKLLSAVLLALVLTVMLEPPAQSKPNDEEANVLRKTKGSIVMLENIERAAGGTGFELMAPDGKKYTVTNAHVCTLAKDGSLVAIREKGPSLLLKVIKVSQNTDLCVLEGIPDVPGLTLKDHEDNNSRVFAVGHPYLRPSTISSGFIVGRRITQVMDDTDPKCDGPGRHMEQGETIFGPQNFCIRNVDSYFTSVIIFPGNSGSPLMDASGSVEGVMFASSDEDHMGSAIPLDDLAGFVSSI